MNPLHAFDSLADIRPGESTVAHAASRFGSPSICECSDGGWFFSFENHGVQVIVDPIHREDPDPVVSEVHLSSPNVEQLPNGVCLGQSQSDALNAVRRSYEITDEYEDAVYFRPTARDDLLASVEFLRAGVVVRIELMYCPIDQHKK